MEQAAIELLKAKLHLGQSMEAAYSSIVKVFGQEVARKARAVVAAEIGQLYLLRDPPIIVEHGLVEWYPGPSDEDVFWPPLKRYLESKKWDAETLSTVDQSSTLVVSRLAPPGLSEIQTRGLVVGYVQSGKTSNFTAVISKAADVNYRLFVVLSGLTNSLRNQTQLRLEAELVALNTGKWLTLTQGDRDFDGRMPVRVDYALSPGPKILVVLKKNSIVLARFIKWLSGGNRSLMQGCPMLVIDDECDQAGVNTSNNEERRSRINQQILKLLACSPKSAYVGYTATPFANVLNEPPLADNLYPRDFILSLPRSQNYFGPERIFGRERLRTEEGDSEIDGLDIIRPVANEEADLLREGLPAFQPKIVQSLENALHYFWMATAARLARTGEIDFSTMLVHTTLRTDIHETYRQELEKYRKEFLDRLSKEQTKLQDELRNRWEDESARLDRAKAGSTLSAVTFDDLWNKFADVVANTKFVVDNYRSQDRLDFSPEQRGSTYVVIGGNTLSRGLTLEGLVVSYFVRTSTAYDTLMQMGRWFGYRKDYEDLPRIWMTDELAENFFDLATVEEEFRAEIKRYSMQRTPAEFGPRIRTHPSLSITSRLKMQAAVQCDMSYGGHRCQTILFKHRDLVWLRDNINAARKLIKDASATSGVEIQNTSQSRVCLLGVPVKNVIEFFNSYHFHERNRELNNELVLRYIADQNKNNELMTWNVVFFGLKDAPYGYLDTGAGKVGLINRSQMPSSDPESANIKTLMSRPDIVADLPPNNDYSKLDEEALFKLREQQFPKRGLIVLYPIYSRSTPVGTAKDPSRQRKPLEAVEDVIGLALVCPSPERDTPEGYMTVDMSRVPREELDFDEDAEVGSNA